MAQAGPVAALNANGPNLGLKILYEPTGGKKENHVDIIFLHGLTGNSYNTWRHAGAGKHWPTELLPQKVPNARIANFGYDADVSGVLNPVSVNQISNHAENLLGALARHCEDRKIIFVAHSLGGLVVQEALRISSGHAKPHIRRIEAQTIAIAFLVTPHHGSDLVKWVTFGQNFARIVSQVNKDIVSVLRPGSEMLAVIQSGFHSLVRRRRDEQHAPLDITCFYEEIPSGGVVVVPTHSAILPGYSNYGIHANHTDMVKFRDADDEGFLNVAGEIERWGGRVNSQNPTITQTLPAHVKNLSAGEEPGKEPVVVTYFLGFDRSEVARSIEGILRSLLRQILIVNKDLIPLVFQPIRKEAHGSKSNLVTTRASELL